MKHLLIIFLCTAISIRCAAQTYIAICPSLVNTPGTVAGKTNIALEVGRQMGVFSVGADIGKTHFASQPGRDTTIYLEVRPNLNIFEHGKFTNTLTMGIGGVFNAKENFMTELTTGMEYEMNDHYHFNANFGQYYFSGRETLTSYTFFGFSVMHYFGRTNKKALVKFKTEHED